MQNKSFALYCASPNCLISFLFSLETRVFSLGKFATAEAVSIWVLTKKIYFFVIFCKVHIFFSLVINRDDRKSVYASIRRLVLRPNYQDILLTDRVVNKYFLEFGNIFRTPSVVVHTSSGFQRRSI